MAHESIQLYLSTPSMNILRVLHETFCNFISIISSYYHHDYIGKILNNSENVYLSYEISSTKTRYTGWLVTGGTSGKGVILREKRSRKYKIKIFHLRLCFREKRL